ncbi:hypothetical protein NAL19_1874 [Pectobacterium sp. F1-1]|nr:hypothetical protein NAL19_1874 [Pectobacterium sp. F1-1]
MINQGLSYAVRLFFPAYLINSVTIRTRNMNFFIFNCVGVDVLMVVACFSFGTLTFLMRYL